MGADHRSIAATGVAAMRVAAIGVAAMRMAALTMTALATAASSLAVVAVILHAPPVAAQRAPTGATDPNDPARGHRAAAAPQIVKPEKAPSKTSNPTVVVVEGSGTRALWIDPTRVADFGTGGSAEQPALRPPAPGELANGNRSSKRDIAKNVKSETGMATVSETDPTAASATTAATVSPVFVDAGGRARALPGGVIVAFADGITADAANVELAALGVTPLRRIGERMWLVESAPGLAALELAGRLNTSGRFAFVQPNWWQPRTTK